MCFYKVQSYMDACINVSYINAIYKHIHHGEYIHMYIIVLKWCQNIFVNNFFVKKLKIVSRHVNLSWCDEFVICDSTIPKK
jgi:hypothetical protein